MHTPFEEKSRWESRLLPESRRCVCAGKEVPFYCPIHGAVENPEWPLLKSLAAVLDAVKDEEARLIVNNTIVGNDNAECVHRSQAEGTT